MLLSLLLSMSFLLESLAFDNDDDDDHDNEYEYDEGRRERKRSAVVVAKGVAVDDRRASADIT